MIVIISPRARNDLKSIFQYIVKENYIAAQETLDKISHSIENLVFNPNIGRVGSKPGTRELIVPSVPFIIPYTIKKDRIVVLRIYHYKKGTPRL